MTSDETMLTKTATSGLKKLVNKQVLTVI